MQLIKFWPSRAPGKGSVTGRNIWIRLTTASAQCLRLSERFFIKVYCFIISSRLLKCTKCLVIFPNCDFQPRQTAVESSKGSSRSRSVDRERYTRRHSTSKCRSPFPLLYSITASAVKVSLLNPILRLPFLPPHKILELPQATSQDAVAAAAAEALGE